MQASPPEPILLFLQESFQFPLRLAVALAVLEAMTELLHQELAAPTLVMPQGHLQLLQVIASPFIRVAQVATVQIAYPTPVAEQLALHRFLQTQM
jgi:hypothetical protein